MDSVPRHFGPVNEMRANYLVCLDHDKNIWVTLGFPTKTEDGSEIIEPPDSPHVFMVHNLELKDKYHPDGVWLYNVPVIFAHGYRDEKDVWRFANGQSVVETVAAWDNDAIRENRPLIQVIIACNRDRSENPLGVRIKEIPPDKILTQAVGEVVTMKRTNFDIKGPGHLTVRIETGDFFDLDRLIAHREILKDVNVAS